MARARTLVLNTKVQVSGQDQLKSLGQKFSDFGDKIKKGVLNPATLVGGALGGIVAGKTLQLLSDATNAAAEFQDSVSATAQIFGQEAVPELERWADTAHSAFGASKQDALAAANQFATFGKSAGLVGDELTDFSTSMVQLGGDLASFFGGTTEDAIQAVGAALRGESEPIRRYGVLLDDATLKQRAFKMGLIETTTQALTPQQRVLAAQQEILAQTTDAQGDFVRTSDGMANVQRDLAAQLENVNIELGEKLMPVMLKFVKWVRDHGIPVLESFIDNLDEIVDVAGSVLDGLTPIGGALEGEMTDQVQRFDKVLKDMGITAEDTKPVFDHFNGNIEQSISTLEDFNDAGLSVEEGLKQLPTAAEASAAAWEQAQLDTTINRSLDSVAQTAVNTGNLVADSMITAVNEAAAEAATTPAEIAVAVSQGNKSVKDAADDLAGLIPAAMVDAALDAVDAVEQMPADIAQSIIDGRDAVNQAASGLAAAVTDPIRNQANIDEARDKLEELTGAMADALNNGEPTAAIKAELASTEIELAGFLLRADPKSKEAAGLLEKYFKSEDPATREAAEAMMAAVEERAFVMQNDVEEKAAATGEALPDALARETARAEREAYNHFLSTLPPAQRMLDDVGDLAESTATATPDALNRHVKDAGTAADAVASAVKTPLSTLSTSADGWGVAIVNGIVNGMRRQAAIEQANGNLYAIGGMLREGMELGSPPKDPASPLHNIMDWGGSYVRAIADGMIDSLGIARAARDAVANALVPRLAAPTTPRFFGPGGQFVDDLALNEFPAQSASATGGRVVVNLTVQGDLKASERDLPGHIVRALYASGFVNG